MEKTSEFKYFDNIEEALDTNFKYWEVDEIGNISRKDKNYPIDAKRLTEMNWLNHILQKNLNSAEQEFYFVFLEALKKAGYISLTINLLDNLKISAEKSSTEETL